jgi:hypothetical protein
MIAVCPGAQIRDRTTALGLHRRPTGRARGSGADIEARQLVRDPRAEFEVEAAYHRTLSSKQMHTSRHRADHGNLDHSAPCQHNQPMSRSTTLSELSTNSMESCFAHGGEVGSRMQHLDWSATALGTPDSWTPRLKALLGVCLESRVPMAICWGRELTLLHNDAYRSFLGLQYAAMLGRPARDVFAETWHLLKDSFLHVMTDGQTVRLNDLHVPMPFRKAAPAGPIAYDFSPIRGRQDRIVGTYIVVTGSPGRPARRPMESGSVRNDVFQHCSGTAVIPRRDPVAPSRSEPFGDQDGKIYASSSGPTQEGNRMCPAPCATRAPLGQSSATGATPE